MVLFMRGTMLDLLVSKSECTMSIYIKKYNVHSIQEPLLNKTFKFFFFFFNFGQEKKKNWLSRNKLILWNKHTKYTSHI